MTGSTRLACLALGATLVCPAAAAAAEPPELRRLFPQEADVFVDGGGLSRLVLSPEVVASCRADLSDLRLFDPAERELAFIVDALAAPSAAEYRERFQAPVLEAARNELRREKGPPLRRETYEIGVPEAPPVSGSWALVLATPRAEFVARVRVEARPARGAALALIEDGSLFRIGGARPAEKLRLALPAFAARRLGITIETEHPFWLEPSFALESLRAVEGRARIAVPLEAHSTTRAGPKTVVELGRPRGLVPDILRLETSTDTFDRQVEVWDDGPGRVAGPLGSGRVFRVVELAGVGEQEVELQPARGDRLRVAIDDGDSPALSDLAFSAVIRQPSLIFSLPTAPGPREPAARLRFGGARAHLPRYDVAGLLPAMGRAEGKRAEAAAALRDPAVVGAARLGAVRANPHFDGAPALEFAMRPGARIERGVFRRLRRLRVPEAREGLSRLRLGPEDLAALDETLSDLRVVDGESRQWPYLIEREAASELVPLTVEGPESARGTSRFRLVPPAAPLGLDRMFLDAEAPFFDRAYQIVTRDRDGERVLGSGRLVRAPDDARPVAVDFVPARVGALELVVEDGDDAPLRFRSARARLPVPELYLTAPAGEYALLLGAADQEPPRYELERVREVVLAVQAAPIEASELGDNPDYSLGARLRGAGLRQSVVLWVVLIAAVGFLAALTLRLARRESASGGR